MTTEMNSYLTGVYQTVEDQTTDLGCILDHMQVTVSDEGNRTFTPMNIWSLVRQYMKWSENKQYILFSVMLFDVIIIKVQQKSRLKEQILK